MSAPAKTMATREEPQTTTTTSHQDATPSAINDTGSVDTASESNSTGEVSPSKSTPTRQGVLSKKKSRAPPKFFKPYTVPDSPEAMHALEAVSCSTNAETSSSSDGVGFSASAVPVASSAASGTAQDTRSISNGEDPATSSTNSSMTTTESRTMEKETTPAKRHHDLSTETTDREANEGR